MMVPLNHVSVESSLILCTDQLTWIITCTCLVDEPSGNETDIQRV